MRPFVLKALAGKLMFNLNDEMYQDRSQYIIKLFVWVPACSLELFMTDPTGILPFKLVYLTPSSI